MIDIIKKILIVAAVLLLIWALIDPVSAAAFVQFLYVKIQDALIALFTFIHNVFN